MESVEMRWWQGAEVFQEGYVVEGRLFWMISILSFFWFFS